MDNPKYVVLDFMGIDTIFIFPNYVTHSDFVNIMEMRDRVISAGFLNTSPIEGKVKAYGESISLDVKSNPETDTWLAEKALFPDW